MQLYAYRAFTGDGDPVRGLMEATRPGDVRDALAARSLRVVEVRRRRRSLSPATLFPAAFAVRPAQVVMFCRQLATFVRVGIPVTTAVTTIGEQSGGSRMRAACTSMVSDLERGASLSEALAAHPTVFPALMVDMVRAAEVSGDLDAVLGQAGRHIEREAAARRRIHSAMTYPAVVLGMATIIAAGMVAFVLPQFRELFREYHAGLPVAVRLLLGVSDGLREHAVAIALAALVLVLAGGRLLRTDTGRMTRDRLVLRLPLIGRMARAAAVERFCRTLSDMLVAGVPITQIFPVIIATTGNRVYRRALREVAAQMTVGEGFSRPLRRTGLFPPMVTQMIRVGEETGTLDVHLHEASEMYGEELEFRIKRLTAVAEPVLIVGVAVMVGFLAISMVSAIYSLAGAIR
ncbi:MAG TPA: type II secretion system F family protein [Candidatus Dormibacteraeota bacterium]